MMLFALGVRLTSLTRSGLALGLLGALARPLLGLAIGIPLAWALGLEGAARGQLLLFAALPPASLLAYVAALAASLGFVGLLHHDLHHLVASLIGHIGLKPGDRWCLCAPRWKDALDDGCAPQLVLESTHEETLAIVPLGCHQAHEGAGTTLKIGQA